MYSRKVLRVARLFETYFFKYIQFSGNLNVVL